jgi:hypothetical protein
MTARALSIKRLRRLCGMFGSDHDCERASAGRLAHQLIRQHGLTWEDVIARPAAPLAAEPLPMAWRDACQQILASGCMPWEWKFCHHLLDKWHGPLTEKQSTCLARIFELRVSDDRRQRA